MRTGGAAPLRDRERGGDGASGEHQVLLPQVAVEEAQVDPVRRDAGRGEREAGEVAAQGLGAA
ncbi:MAG: hypothetical protein ACRDQ7_23250, partial [Haloechinothrix sp.]